MVVLYDLFQVQVYNLYIMLKNTRLPTFSKKVELTFIL